MGRITFTADAHHEDIIDDVESEDDVESRSEAVRKCITRTTSEDGFDACPYSTTQAAEQPLTSQA